MPVVLSREQLQQQDARFIARRAPVKKQEPAPEPPPPPPRADPALLAALESVAAALRASQERETDPEQLALLQQIVESINAIPAPPAPLAPARKWIVRVTGRDVHGRIDEVEFIKGE